MTMTGKGTGARTLRHRSSMGSLRARPVLGRRVRPGARRPGVLGAAASLLGLWAACTYDPHPADGALACSPAGECPEGYTCRSSSSTCFSTAGGGAASGGTGGATAADASRGTGGASAGADAGSDAGGGPISAIASDYLGTWIFGVAASVDTTCSDGTTPTTTSLADRPTDREILTVGTGPTGVAALTANWLCSINLDVDSAGAHLGTGVDSCSQARNATAPATAPLSSTWTATRYDLTLRTTDRSNATLVADYTRVDTYSATRVVTCAQKVHAPLHKQ
jgi:hypothetical protein